MIRRIRRLVMRRERIDLLRDMLIEALGGACVDCGSTRNLEPDHVNGCTWDRAAAGRENRIRRYVSEFREGVALLCRCSSCNRALNQHAMRRAWSAFEAWRTGTAI